MTKRLFELALQTRWAMKGDALDAMLGVLQRHDLGQKLEPAEVARIRSAKNTFPGGWMARALDGVGAAVQVNGPEADITLTQVGSVAVVGVGGVLAKYASSVNDVSGPSGTSVEAIRTVLAQAMADPAVGSVLLMVDSPGGSVSGLGTLAGEIRAASKPVWAYIDDMGASAAYWISSQAKRVYQSPGAVVGSIGVMAVVADNSQAVAARGVKVHLIRSGPAKGVGTSGVPIDEAALAVLQGECDAFFAEFLGDISAGRPSLSGEKLAQVSDGRVWVGQAAVNLGLTDGIAMVGDVLNEMNAKFPAPSRQMPRRMAAERSAGAERPVSAASLAAIAGGLSNGVITASVETNEPPQGGDTPPRVAADAGGESGSAGKGPVMAGEVVTGANSAQGAGPQSGTPGNVDKSVMEAMIARATTAALAADQARRDEIRAISAPFAHVAGMSDLLATAEKDMKVEDFRARALDLVAKAQQPAPQVSVGESGADRKMSAFALALADKASGGKLQRVLSAESGSRMSAALRAAGVNASAGRSFTAAAAHAMDEAQANGIFGARLSDIAREMVARRSPEQLRAIGYSQESLFRAAASNTTSDFPILMKNVANLVLQSSFVEAPTTWRQWCKKGTANDYKDQTIARASEFEDLELIPEGQEADQGTFNERAETISVNKSGKKFFLTYEAYRNDSLSAFAETPMKMGLAGARLPEKKVYAALEANANMSDGNPLFDATHGNVEGSPGAISYTTLKAAWTAMVKQKGFGPDKAPIEVRPKFLIVPVELELVAQEIINSQYAPSTGSTPINTDNSIRNRFTVIGANYLTSATAFYLASDPTFVPAMQVNFLDGREEPQIDALDSDNPFVLGWQATVLGCGVAPLNWEALYKNAGG